MATKTKEGTSVEPDFNALTGDLARADVLAKSVSSDAGAARAERSRIAISTIKAAYSEALPVGTVRRALLDAGVLKGTVSKICTVLQAILDGTVSSVGLKSLNGAYSLARGTGTRAAAAAAVAAAAPIVPVVVAPPTTDEALEIILSDIKYASDVFAAGSAWMTRITNAIAAIIKKSDEDKEEE